MSSIQLLAGKIYAQFPQKLVFLVFFGLFMLGSLLCGVAVNSPMFIVGRATAGAGAAGVLSGTLAIVSAVVPLDKQSLILGLMMSLVGTAVVLGPVISGLLTDHSTWRWCFYLNLPCGGVTLLALILFFRPPKRPTRTTPLSIPELIKKLDLAGCLGFIPAVVMLLLALQWGGDGSKEHAWNSATIIGLFCGAGVSLILFLIWEHYQGDDAMLPLKFFRDLTIIASCLYGFALLGGYVVVGYFLPEWFQIIKGANPQSSAVMLLPNVITNFISKAVIGVIGSFPSPSYPHPRTILTPTSQQNRLLQPLALLRRGCPRHRLRPRNQLPPLDPAPQLDRLPDPPGRRARHYPGAHPRRAGRTCQAEASDPRGPVAGHLLPVLRQQHHAEYLFDHLPKSAAARAGQQGRHDGGAGAAVCGRGQLGGARVDGTNRSVAVGRRVGGV